MRKGLNKRSDSVTKACLIKEVATVVNINKHFSGKSGKRKGGDFYEKEFNKIDTNVSCKSIR